MKKLESRLYEEFLQKGNLNKSIEKQSKVMNRQLRKLNANDPQTFEKMVSFICNQENAH